MKRTLFFSWQSDIPSHLVVLRKAIRNALKKMPKEDRYQLFLDESTQDLSGAISISEAIYNKIKNCDVFIADTSIVNYSQENKKKGLRIGPNPNVIHELGFAAACIGWERIITITDISNSSHARFRPFDTRQHRTIEFDFVNGDPSKLVSALHYAINSISKNEVSNLKIKEFVNGRVHDLFLHFYSELRQFLHFGKDASTLAFIKSISKLKKSKFEEKLMESRVLGFYIFRSIQPRIEDIEKLLDRPMLTKYLTKKTEAILVSLMTSLGELDNLNYRSVIKVRRSSTTDIYNTTFNIRNGNGRSKDLVTYSMGGFSVHGRGEFRWFRSDHDLKSIYRFKKGNIGRIVDVLFEINTLYKQWKKEIGWVEVQK